MHTNIFGAVKLQGLTGERCAAQKVAVLSKRGQRQNGTILLSLYEI